MKENERKFLIKRVPENLEQYPHEEILQGYLVITDHKEERVRRKGNNKYTHTIKTDHGLSRDEQKEEITKEQFEPALEKTKDRIVRKTRYIIPSYEIELDIYHQELEGLKTAEVEFDNIEESQMFSSPEWLGKEVTYNKQYKNQSLAVYGIPGDYFEHSDTGKKYVLTGGPGSGKTSIILALEDKEEYVIREAAKDWIKLQQAKGIQEPWLKSNFQEKILEMQFQREKKAEEHDYDRLFIDRGLLDGLAYYQISGKTPTNRMNEIKEKIEKERPYEKIFIIENLGFCRNNKVRRENQDEALELEKLQEQNYRSVGYKPIRIGPGPVEERTEKILHEVN